MQAEEEEQKQKDKPVTHEEHDSDLEEILSQIRDLQTRVAALERKESQ
jgi:hypothetical protein